MKTRWRQHKNRKPQNNFFRLCIKKYGEKNFKIEILFLFSSQDKAYEKEKYLINKHKTNICRYPEGVGMNMSDGGERGNYGYVATEEHRKNLSKAFTGRKITNTENMRKAKLGAKNPMYGKKMSEEGKKQRSDFWKTDANPMKGKTGKNNPLYGRERPKHVKEALLKNNMKRARPVLQICPETNKVLNEFESCGAACRSVNIKNGVHGACNKKQKTAGGYKWRYKK